ncbi:MAG: nucleotide exchange factor GrpE [Candidatus Hydrogenedentota bacterium]
MKEEKEEIKEEVSEEEKLKQELENMKKLIEEMQNENNELKELHIRLQAEFQNYTKRLDREFSEKEKYIETSLVKALIPIFDSVNTAKLNLEGIKDNGIKGLLLIFDELIKVFTERGLEIINPLDKEYDPLFHEALGFETDETKEDNICLKVLLQGYLYKSRVIRPARVIINRKQRARIEDVKSNNEEKECG